MSEFTSTTVFNAFSFEGPSINMFLLMPLLVLVLFVLLLLLGALGGESVLNFPIKR